MILRAGFLALAGLLAGCGLATPPEPPVSLPPVAARAALNPVTAALRGAATAFAETGRLQGRPALAALAVAQLEYLAVEMPSGRVAGDIGMVQPLLLAARQEVRGVLGIPATVPPQRVIDALAAAATVPGGDAAAPATLPPDVAPGGGALLWQRLGALPRLPQANAATQRALHYWEFGPDEAIEISMLGRRP
ncbi:hypothetical protein NON00_03225 [Roseomonas sp. GC11]|nr:hypothetical protein [Roseomonas sp. GC11]